MDIKKKIKSFFAVLFSCLIGLTAGCDSGSAITSSVNLEHSSNAHTHLYTCKNTSEAYLKTEPSCISPAEYFYSCLCGEKGSESFQEGDIKAHEWIDNIAAEYLKKNANCSTPAQYYKSCKNCLGKNYNEFFIAGEVGSCNYSKGIIKEEYLKYPATCQGPAIYYKSCVCGKKGEATFTYGENDEHDYSVQSREPQYLKYNANCQEGAQYYYSCSACGSANLDGETFTYGEAGECDYSREKVEERYLKSEATTESPAIYYKSCVCGKTNGDTFIYGDKLPILDEATKALYMPTSLTVSMYNAQESIYGFTFNTVNCPQRSLLQIKKKGDLFWVNYEVASIQYTSFNGEGEAIYYYVSKCEVKLDTFAEYVYRIYDKGVGVGTGEMTLETNNPQAEAFTFVHVSDTQAYPDYFKRVLTSVVGKANFLLHTGDVVESSKYEYEWTAMLDGNKEYLSQIPIMAISGNHETTYKNGSNETFKHFNYNIPQQKETSLGFFYSFEYGNVKFIMLNTNDLANSQLKPEQYDWLVQELKNNDSKWTIVSMHNPMYSVGQWGADTSKNGIALSLRTQLQGIFAQYGVDIVLQGHDHTINRTHPINRNGQPQTETFENISGVEYSINPKGTIYLTNGTAGGQNEKPYIVDASNEHLYSYTDKSQKSTWAEISVSGDSLTVSVKYHDGDKDNVQYTWGIKKTA